MRRCLTFLPIAAVPLVFLGIMVAAPLWAMLGYGDAAPLWREMLESGYFRHRIGWTVFQAAATVLLALLLGVPSAWVLARLDFAGRKWVLQLLMLPFVMPTLVAGMGVLVLFGNRGVLWRGWSDTAALLLYGAGQPFGGGADFGGGCVAAVLAGGNARAASMAGGRGVFGISVLLFGLRAGTAAGRAGIRYGGGGGVPVGCV